MLLKSVVCKFRSTLPDVFVRLNHHKRAETIMTIDSTDATDATIVTTTLFSDVFVPVVHDSHVHGI